MFLKQQIHKEIYGCCILIFHASSVWLALLQYCDVTTIPSFVITQFPHFKVNSHCFVADSQSCTNLSTTSSCYF